MSHFEGKRASSEEDTLPIEVVDLLQIRGDREEIGSNQTQISTEDTKERDMEYQELELEDIKEPEEESVEVVALLQIKGDREEVGSNHSEMTEEDEIEREKELAELLLAEEKEAVSDEHQAKEDKSIPLQVVNIAKENKLAIYFHPDCTSHYVPDHPEQPARVKFILNTLKQHYQHDTHVIFREASYALDEHIALFHTNELIASFHEKWKEVENIYQKKKEVVYRSIDGDTKVMRGTKAAAYRAVGSVLDAVDHLYTTDEVLSIDTAFCCIRPPGHHAERNLSCGFCFFNNVAIASKYAQSRYHVDKVAVLDFDVHHGNGTEEGFIPHDNLFYASTHEKDNFPGTGIDPSPYVGEKSRNPLYRRIVNRTLPPGPKSRGEFRVKWIEILKEMELFQPELIIISAGFDAHDEDPLASVELIEEDYLWITREILKSGLRINASNPPKVFSVLEGGYDLQAIAKSALVHVQALKEGYIGVANEVLQEEDSNEIDDNGRNHHGDEVAALRQYLQDLGLN